MVVTRMRFLARFLCLFLLLGGPLAFAPPALAQSTVAPPQRPFGQLVDLWTRQLDRIAYRSDQSDIRATEIDALREQTSDVRDAANAAAQLARNDLTDTKQLLAPLEVKAGPDQPPESDAVKADRKRLTDQATVSESRLKQCEMVIARADQLLERLTRLRGQVVLQTLLHRNVSPLSTEAWDRLLPQFRGAVRGLTRALGTWSEQGLRDLRAGQQNLLSFGAWAALTIALWWGGRVLRRRYGRGGDAEPGRRDRTIAALVDGLGMVLVPILAVWLISRLLAASQPPSPLDALLGELTEYVISLLLVFGVTATALAPDRPQWRILPFTDESARALSTALRRLMAVSFVIDFVYYGLTLGREREALSAILAVAPAVTVALFTLPALSNRAWMAARPEGSTLPAMVGGPWWMGTRVLLRVIVLSAIVFALLGFTTLATHIHQALADTCFLVSLAILAHWLFSDLLDTLAKPETSSGIWVRSLFALAPDAKLYGLHLVLLLIDAVLVIGLCILLPATWNADTDAILRGFGQLLHGVKIGSVTISLTNIGMAIVAFGICMLLAKLVRGIVRDRVLPTVNTPLPLRQSIDAGLNYLGVAVAALVGIGALGIDFTNLAIVLGALSVGIGLGLQNIANNVISGVILLVERPIKAGDWVSVNGHEGFVRRINIRATEIETFQRTHVIVPNSIFLQNPVINRTYSDTSSRIEIPIAVPQGTNVVRMETILREAALGHPRVLRVPSPIVRFVRVAATALDFELFVFVALLEDRLVVTNDLNRAILARLIEEKIIDPAAPTEFKVRDLDKLAAALRMDHGTPPPG